MRWETTYNKDFKALTIEGAPRGLTEDELGLCGGDVQKSQAAPFLYILHRKH